MTDEDVLKPIDLVGNEPANRVVDELHDLNTLHSTFIVPIWGAFYKDSLVIYDVTNSAVVVDTKYDFMDLHLDATMKSGKSVYEFIRITDDTVGKLLKISYQALGGSGSRHRENLITWLHQRQVNSGAVDWNEVTDKPKAYHPAFHNHILNHIFGLEYITNELERVKQAIVAGNDSAYQSFIDMLDHKFQSAMTQVDNAITQILTDRLNDFKNSVRGAGIGLSNIINSPLMTRPEAKSIADPGFDSLFVNAMPKNYVSLNSLDAFKDYALTVIVPTRYTRLGQITNEYIRPTKAGFLELLDGGIGIIPSKQKVADESIEFDFHVYPKDCNATDEFFVERVITNNSNAGGVFMLRSTTNFDTYIGLLINDACHEKITWNKLFVEGELDTFIKTVTDHFLDDKNPHEVDKKDIKLNNIENYKVVSEEEIINKISAKKYVTPDTLMYFMKAFLTNAKPPPKPGDPVDPNAKLMDQCQIIFGTCSPKEDIPNNFPPKGQLIKTFCDGKDRFARFTDGKGSFYDEVLEKNDIDCGYVEYIAAGTTLNTFCDGTDKKAKVADGAGGNYDIVIAHKSPECGYKDNMVLGTVISVFCSGEDKLTRYADGEGGSYDMITQVNSPDCGFTTPSPGSTPNPSQTPSPSGTPSPGSTPSPTATDYSLASLIGSTFLASSTIIPQGMSGDVSTYVTTNSSFNIKLLGTGFPKNITASGVIRIRRGTTQSGSTVHRTYNLSSISSNDQGKIDKVINLNITPPDVTNNLKEYIEVVLSFNYATRFYEIKKFLTVEGKIDDYFFWYIPTAPTPAPPPDYRTAVLNPSVVSASGGSTYKIDTPFTLNLTGSGFPPETAININLEILRGDTISTSSIVRIGDLGSVVSSLTGTISKTFTGDITPPDVTIGLKEYIRITTTFIGNGQTINVFQNCLVSGRSDSAIIWAA